MGMLWRAGQGRGSGRTAGVALAAALLLLVPGVAAAGRPAQLTAPAASPGPASGQGYWLVASDGGIFNYGDAGFFGSAGAIHLNRPIVGMAATADGNGYWLVASDGGIFNYGDAGFFGSAGAIHLNRPIVGMAATADGNGYWLVASDGGIFNYGNAGFFGSAGGIHLNRPIVGMAPTPDGKGYWLVASDGGIFNYGDAGFFGSAGGIHLNRPIVGMAPGTNGSGYWLVASDGGIFNYATALYGSAGGIHLNRPIVSMAPTADGGGYWLVASDGGIFNYGDATFQGSAGGLTLAAPIVGAAGAGVGSTMGAPPVPPAPPVVTAVSPAGGATTGGTAVTITGQHLSGATSVSFGSTAGSIVSVSDAQVVATAPAEPAGTVDIQVTTPSGTSSAVFADRFTYFIGAPSVSGISPSHGLTTGGTAVTVSGSNLAGATEVRFGTTAAAIVSNTNTQIVATSPVEGAGTVHVTVTTPHGTSSSTSADQFTYQVPPPSVTRVSPATASTAGNTFVTIDGANLTGATAVHFGNAAGTILDSSSTQIFAASPAGSAGTVDVTLTGPGGTSAVSASDHFTYSATAPATVTQRGQFGYGNDQPAVSSSSVDVSATPATGDLLALAVEEKYPGATDTAFSAGSVHGGGVVAWHKAHAYQTSDGIHGEELWYGTVTVPGTSTITVDFSGLTTETMSDPESAASLDAVDLQSSSGAATVWNLDKTGQLDDGSSSATPDFPTLNPSSSAEAYFGYLAVSGNASGGTTWGCVYGTDLRSNEVVQQRSVSTPITPQAVSDTNAAYASIGMLVEAS